MTPTATESAQTKQVTSLVDTPLEQLIQQIHPPAEAWFTSRQLAALAEIIRRAHWADQHETRVSQ